MCIKRQDVLPFLSRNYLTAPPSSTSSSPKEESDLTPWFLRNMTPRYSSQLHHISQSASQLHDSVDHLSLDHLRFSKWSISSALIDSPTGAALDIDQGGACLLVCKVLLERVCTVAGVVEARDIAKARPKGYDAIYSQARSVQYATFFPYYTISDILIDTLLLVL